jgi:hypothetical protein
MSNIHWVTGMDTRYPYPRKIIRGYLIISITVSTDIKFHHTHLMDNYLRLFTCTRTIAIPNLLFIASACPWCFWFGS